MLRLLKRQRRRLALYAVTVALPAAVFVLLLALPSQGAAVAGAISVGVFMAPLAIIIAVLRFAPVFRPLLDQLCALGVLSAVLTPLFFPLEQYVPYIALALIWICLFIVIRTRPLNRFLPKRSYSATARYRTSQSPYRVWAEQLPDPGLVDRHWAPILKRIDLNRVNPDTRVATFASGAAEWRQRQTTTALQMHESFAYDFADLDADGHEVMTGSYEMRILEHGPHRDVQITFRTEPLPFTTWLGYWLDDTVGDQCDYHFAKANALPDYSMTRDLVTYKPQPQDMEATAQTA